MKKIISILLAAAMLLALGATLASCAHQCKFSDDWSGDDEYHWHVCEKKNCEEIDGKDEHEWDEGEITTPATQEKDGEKTFTCKVCKQKKTEKVVFTGLTKEEWNAAFANSVFENFMYKETATSTTSGVSVETEMIYKFTKDSVWGKMTMGNNSEEDFTDDKTEVDEIREQLVGSIKDMTPYDKFEYDAQTKTYKAKSPIKMEAIGGNSTSDITLKFDGGKLVEVNYTISFTQGGMSFNATSKIVLSDYGTVELDV